MYEHEDRRPGRISCPAVQVLVDAVAGLAMMEPAANDAELIEQIA